MKIDYPIHKFSCDICGKSFTNLVYYKVEKNGYHSQVYCGPECSLKGHAVHRGPER